VVSTCMRHPSADSAERLTDLELRRGRISMTVAIRGHQGPSGAIRGHQGPSGVIRGHQGPSHLELRRGRIWHARAHCEGPRARCGPLVEEDVESEAAGGEYHRIASVSAVVVVDDLAPRGRSATSLK